MVLEQLNDTIEEQGKRKKQTWDAILGTRDPVCARFSSWVSRHFCDIEFRRWKLEKGVWENLPSAEKITKKQRHMLNDLLRGYLENWRHFQIGDPGSLAWIFDPAFYRVCQGYLESVRDIDIVQAVYLITARETSMLWTIIDAPPFEDSLRQPIYSAQLEVLRKLDRSMVVDFYIINLQELPENKNLASIIPHNAALLWRR